jgi:hypothetical protein
MKEDEKISWFNLSDGQDWQRKFFVAQTKLVQSLEQGSQGIFRGQQAPDSIRTQRSLIPAIKKVQANYRGLNACEVHGKFPGLGSSAKFFRRADFGFPV